MAIELISTIKPKNNGDFPIAEAVDISVDANGKRLSDVLTEIDTSIGDMDAALDELHSYAQNLTT